MMSITWLSFCNPGDSMEGKKNKCGAFIPCDDSMPPVLINNEKNRERYQISTSDREQVKTSPSALTADKKATTANKIPWIRSRSFHQTYRLGKLLGRGTFAVVHEAVRQQEETRCSRNGAGGNDDDNSENVNLAQDDHPSSSSSRFAVKIVQRSNMDRRRLMNFRNEVQILSNLQQHEGIVRLYEVYKEQDYFFLVQENLAGGDLFDRLVQINTYREVDARNAMNSILQAIKCIHSQKVAHRDLKPENLLLKDDNNDTTIKVADFGFAKRVERPNSLTTLCGSPLYIAPEILNYKPYDERVDMWSLGVILFTMLGGYPPFDEPTIHMTYQQVRQANYQFHSDYWDGVSPDAKNLIRSLLVLDPTQRLSASEALQHPWMTGRDSRSIQLLAKQQQPQRGQNKSITDHNSLSGGLLSPLNRKSRERFQHFNARRKKQQADSRSKILKSVSHYWLVTRH